MLERRLGDNESMVNEAYSAFQAHKDKISSQSAQIMSNQANDLLMVIEGGHETIAAVQKGKDDIKKSVELIREGIDEESEEEDLERADQ